MISIDPHALLIGFVVGLPASAIFFVGLAMGMRLALAADTPAVWLVLSFFTRAAVLLGVGFLLTKYLHPLWSIVGYMLAFLVMRIVMVRYVKSAKNINLTGQGES